MGAEKEQRQATKKKEKSKSTVYDNVHRSMEAMCSHWLIPLTNEIFKEQYTGQEEVVLGRNEHMGRKDTKEIKKRITDSYYTIQLDKQKERYHLENQSTPDGSILQRMWEYDAMIAVENSVEQEEELNVDIPRSAVIYLRSNENTPNQMCVRIKTSSGEVVQHVPILKIRDYTIDEILDKRLFFLIPYHIFVYENSFMMYNKDAEELEKLQKIYTDIIKQLEGLVLKRVLKEHECQFLIEMSWQVIKKIAENYENILKGLSEIMGGKVLESRVFKAYNEGIALGRSEGISQGWRDGRSEGIVQGKLEGALDMCVRFVKQGIITLAEAAQELGMTEEEFAAKLQ